MKPPSRPIPLPGHPMVLTPGALAAIEGAVALDRGHAHAAHLGMSTHADTTLTRAQGLTAGSTPTTGDLAAARNLLRAEALRAGPATQEASNT
ncbi:hypothetical protein [Kitasatospora purpeofusca]|uniref:hypothetical protein n=1 Tax=Kitasatospora purpeofusca TaxID=67352 RepID=UPI002A59D6DB|nr:hypothetical protein [Kitasatospora purpeofusca]MDY0816556.1 hypothetical protein [Kitasatospora purpeofusca]